MNLLVASNQCSSNYINRQLQIQFFNPFHQKENSNAQMLMDQRKYIGSIYELKQRIKSHIHATKKQK